MASLAGTTAEAGDLVDGAPITHAASRCAQFGPEFFDMGSGTCGRASSHVRVELGMRNAIGDTWTTNGTSSATLRSDGMGYMPGTSDAHHLRVRGGLESFSPFQ